MAARAATFVHSTNLGLKMATDHNRPATREKDGPASSLRGSSLMLRCVSNGQVAPSPPFVGLDHPLPESVRALSPPIFRLWNRR